VKSDYFVVLFSSDLNDIKDSNYHKFSHQMLKEVQHAPGFLGMESYREDSGKGVTISYWVSEKDIQNWKANAEHLIAQKYGKSKAYSRYSIRVCKIHREYHFDTDKENQ
jgi:heme-degrading monooxygenase HmoA